MSWHDRESVERFLRSLPKGKKKMSNQDEALRNEIARLNSAVVALRGEKNHLESEITSLKKDLEDAKAQSKAWEEEAHENEKLYIDSEDRLAPLKEAIVRLVQLIAKDDGRLMNLLPTFEKAVEAAESILLSERGGAAICTGLANGYYGTINHRQACPIHTNARLVSFPGLEYFQRPGYAPLPRPRYNAPRPPGRARASTPNAPVEPATVGLRNSLVQPAGEVLRSPNPAWRANTYYAIEADRAIEVQSAGLSEYLRQRGDEPVEELGTARHPDDPEP